MRLFSIEEGGKFKEFVKISFQCNYEEAVLEEWLDNNPDDIVEDGKLLIVGRQVTTNLGNIIDLLAVDRQGDVVVLELKRGRTPRETLAQSLEYASFAETLDGEQIESILRLYMNDEGINLTEYHRQYFNICNDEAISFNKNQRIVIIGQVITDEIRQTSSFLRNKGIRVTCIEFSFFETKSGEHLLSHDIVVGKEPSRISHINSGSLPVVSKKEFFELLNQDGKPVFKRILELAESHAYPIHWGTKGFSLNVNVNEMHIPICFGYPPGSVFKQSVYTGLGRRGGLLSKINISEDEVESVLSTAQRTGLFQKAGNELKCVINRNFSEDDIDSLINWIDNVAGTIQNFGLKE
ncbi:MAG: hypothetical protein PHE15_00830 [Dehalococcoidales bacterium]|nr:hypothetical protein [Dehalococcoidales bacterium]